MEEKVLGKWLNEAFKAQGVTPYRAAKLTSVRPDKYYRHISDIAHLSAESLRALATTFPTLNLRYVLTGIGEPIL